jgi:hypothetical protein
VFFGSDFGGVGDGVGIGVDVTKGKVMILLIY